MIFEGFLAKKRGLTEAEARKRLKTLFKASGYLPII